MKKVYVGNLPFSVTEEQLRTIFSQRGVVHTVSLVGDRATDRFRGYGYLEIDDESLEAVLKLDGKAIDGRPMKVNEVVENGVVDMVGGEAGEELQTDGKDNGPPQAP